MEKKMFKKIFVVLLVVLGVANFSYAETKVIQADNVNIDSTVTSQVCAGTGTVRLGVNCTGGGTQKVVEVENDGDLALPSSLTFTAGQGVRLPTYVPTMAATPVAGTNMFKVGLNVVPTAAANTAALLDATPTPGNTYVIYNSGANSIRIKGGGATTINGATAGGYVVLATLQSAVCRVTSASNANCILEVAPTPAGP